MAALTREREARKVLPTDSLSATQVFRIGGGNGSGHTLVDQVLVVIRMAVLGLADEMRSVARDVKTMFHKDGEARTPQAAGCAGNDRRWASATSVPYIHITRSFVAPVSAKDELALSS